MNSAGPKVRARSRRGRCYELAFKGQIRDTSWILVHGTVRGRLRNGTIGRIGHAWLVKGQEVYDPVLDASTTAEEYANKYAAVEERRYTAEEMAKLVLSTNSRGPWHETNGATLE
jgi:hypothetical protein